MSDALQLVPTPEPGIAPIPPTSQRTQQATDPLLRITQPRPPALGPRWRQLDPVVSMRIESWFRTLLQVASDTPIAVSEWVSMDSRTSPHTLHVVVGTSAERHFVIAQASERLTEADVQAAISSQQAD